MVSVQLVVIIIVNVVSVLSAYWMTQKKVGETIVLHGEKITNLECEVKKLKELATQVALIKHQVHTLAESIERLTATVDDIKNELLTSPKKTRRTKRPNG